MVKHSLLTSTSNVQSHSGTQSPFAQRSSSLFLFIHYELPYFLSPFFNIHASDGGVWGLLPRRFAESLTTDLTAKEYTRIQ